MEEVWGNSSLTVEILERSISKAQQPQTLVPAIDQLGMVTNAGEMAAEGSASQQQSLEAQADFQHRSGM